MENLRKKIMAPFFFKSFEIICYLIEDPFQR